jgi:hypothetical protein
MHKTLVAAAGLLMAHALVSAQQGDATKILAEVRQALGGEQKLAEIRSLTASGQTARSMGESSSVHDFEVAFELPDKFVKKEVIAVLGTATISRTSGFNGEGVIDEVDRPPSHGGAMVFRAGPGGLSGGSETPEQAETRRKASLLSSRQEFARLLLGMLAASPETYPLQFTYAGQAESPDGKADVIDVKGDGEFVARLFVDTATHLPLMLSWQAKEPISVSVGGPGRGGMPGGGGVAMQRMTAGSPEERDRLMAEMQERMKEAEANRRVVEFRMYYSDYKEVSGVKVPTRITRSVDGRTTEELTLEKIKVNPKIDAGRFQTTK